MTRAAIVLTLLATLGASSVRAEDAPASEAPTYDAALAAKLGGDEYGMKKYVLAILKTGPKDAEIKDQSVLDRAAQEAELNWFATSNIFNTRRY